MWKEIPSVPPLIVWQGGSFWHSKSWLEQLKAAGKGLGFQKSQWIWTSQEVWHTLLEAGPWHPLYKANTWRTLYSQSPAPGNWGWSVFKISLSKLICRRLIWGSTSNFYLVFGFQDHLWAGDSATGICVLQYSSWWGVCACLSVPSVPKHISARNLTLCNVRKKRKHM